MRATIMRRIEAAERSAPAARTSRTVFMLAGADEARFLADMEARHPTCDLCVIEALPADLADDASAAHALLAGIAAGSAGKAVRAEAGGTFGLDAARRLAFVSAQARREAIQ